MWWPMRWSERGAVSQNSIRRLGAWDLPWLPRFCQCGEVVWSASAVLIAAPPRPIDYGAVGLCI